MLKDSIKTIALSLITLSLLSIAYAWTEPALTPPSGNTSTPLNTSGTAQIKTGGLWLNSGGASTGLIVENGNVGIGTTSPGATLDVNGNIKVKNGVKIYRCKGNPMPPSGNDITGAENPAGCSEGSCTVELTLSTTCVAPQRLLARYSGQDGCGNDIVYNCILLGDLVNSY